MDLVVFHETQEGVAVAAACLIELNGGIGQLAQSLVAEIIQRMGRLQPGAPSPNQSLEAIGLQLTQQRQRQVVPVQSLAHEVLPEGTHLQVPPGKRVARVRGELHQRQEHRHHRVVPDEGPAFVDDAHAAALAAKVVHYLFSALVAAHQDSRGKALRQRIDLLQQAGNDAVAVLSFRLDTPFIARGLDDRRIAIRGNSALLTPVLLPGSLPLRDCPFGQIRRHVPEDGVDRIDHCLA